VLRSVGLVTDPDELRAALAAVGDALDAMGVLWAIGGSLASAAYGEPRATNDVDIIATLDITSARKLTESLTGFYADAETAVDAATRHSSFNVIDERSFVKIDLFVPPAGPMGEGQLVRRRRLELMPGLSVPVLGPEDVVLQKLRWFEMGGRVSDRQWRDLVAVLRSQDLDDVYLVETADLAGLRGLLEDAIRDAKNGAR
jgi:hypothetical protein